MIRHIKLVGVTATKTDRASHGSRNGCVLETSDGEVYLTDNLRGPFRTLYEAIECDKLREIGKFHDWAWRLLDQAVSLNQLFIGDERAQVHFSGFLESVRKEKVGGRFLYDEASRVKNALDLLVENDKDQDVDPDLQHLIRELRQELGFDD